MRPDEDVLKQVGVAFAILQVLDSGPRDTQSLQRETEKRLKAAVTDELFRETLAGLATNRHIVEINGLWTLKSRGGP